MNRGYCLISASLNISTSPNIVYYLICTTCIVCSASHVLSTNRSALHVLLRAMYSAPCTMYHAGTMYCMFCPILFYVLSVVHDMYFSQNLCKACNGSFIFCSCCLSGPRQHQPVCLVLDVDQKLILKISVEYKY